MGEATRAAWLRTRRFLNPKADYCEDRGRKLGHFGVENGRRRGLSVQIASQSARKPRKTRLYRDTQKRTVVRVRLAGGVRRLDRTLLRSNSLINRESAGNFCEKRLRTSRLRALAAGIAAIFRKFPTQRSREFIEPCREFRDPSREFRNFELAIGDRKVSVHFSHDCRA